MLVLVSVLTLQLLSTYFISGFAKFCEHLLFWKDGTYELWDPLLWWWLYHVSWSTQFWNSMWLGKKWSRINVSTTKMFECQHKRHSVKRNGKVSGKGTKKTHCASLFKPLAYPRCLPASTTNLPR